MLSGQSYAKLTCAERSERPHDCHGITRRGASRGSADMNFRFPAGVIPRVRPRGSTVTAVCKFQERYAVLFLQPGNP